MEPSEIDFVKIREWIFRDKYSVDSELLSLVRNTPSHAFLANPASQIIYQFLLRYLGEISEVCLHKDRSSIKVLDWGCGKGHSTFLLNKLGVLVKSCDIINDKLDSAFGQETPIIKSCNINVIPLNHEYQLPFDDNSFDVLLSMGVLEHVQNDKLSLKEINRILKNGGLFFCFFLPQRYSWTQFVSMRLGDNYHNRLYTRTSVEQLLRNANFELKDFWYRQLFPKNTVKYFSPHFFERIDQSLVKYTPLRYLATNIEFVAQK